jgi:hypothetical protein
MLFAFAVATKSVSLGKFMKTISLVGNNLQMPNADFFQA